MVWSVVVNVLWWLTDAAVMGAIPGAVEAFAVMRVCVLVAAALVLALLRGQRELRGLRLAVILGLWLGELGALAACLSVLGDLSTPWFHCLYPLILTSCTIPLALPARALFTTLMGTSLIAGFLLARPSALHSWFLGATIGYTVFTIGVAIAFGHRIYLLTRRNFAQQLTLERIADGLTGQREELRRQVDLRTSELRLLAEHLDRGSEDERRRVAGELHDEIGQSVSALRFALATTLRRFRRDPASIRANLEDLDELVRRVADGTSDAITRLRPRILDDRGLAAAAQWLVGATEKYSGLTCSLRLEDPGMALTVAEAGGEHDADEPRCADATSTAAFRILQEALTNVVRHAGAQRIDVLLRADAAGLELRVEDDGVGLPGTPRTGGMGLLGMRERARALGGELSVESRPGEGTRITCRLPRATGSAA
jgi:signal transduction histidine kinase